jgi:hypothetical protein
VLCTERRYDTEFPQHGGSWKTTITGAFGKYPEREHAVAHANLSIGVKTLPYSPSLDVRYTITVEEITEEGFGPNGAMVGSFYSSAKDG